MTGPIGLAAGVLVAAMLAAVLTGCDRGDSTTARPGGDPTAAAPPKQPIPPLRPIDEVADADADPDYGRDLYLFSCATCHGTNGQGLPKQGASLRLSSFLREKTNAELVAYLKTGRAADDPQNKLGVAMPPLGTPQLTEDQLPHVIAYLRELQAESQEEYTQANKTQGAKSAIGSQPSASTNP